MSPNGSNDLVGLRQGRGGPLCAKKTTPTAQSIFQTAICPGPRLAHRSPVHLAPDCPASSGHQASQGSQMLGPSGGPTLEEPSMVPRVDSAVINSPLANSTEEGPPLTSEGHDLAPEARAVEPSCLVQSICNPCYLRPPH